MDTILMIRFASRSRRILAVSINSLLFY